MPKIHISAASGAHEAKVRRTPRCRTSATTLHRKRKAIRGRKKSAQDSTARVELISKPQSDQRRFCDLYFRSQRRNSLHELRFTGISRINLRMKFLRSKPLSRAHLLIPIFLISSFTSSLATTLPGLPYSVDANSNTLGRGYLIVECTVIGYGLKGQFSVYLCRGASRALASASGEKRRHFPFLEEILL